MRKSTFLLALFLPLFALTQNVGDTIVVPAFNYTQTQSPAGRDTMILFPDNPGVTYEKIILSYNMRCKDGNVSVPGNTNYGCGEWDYKCNTYIYDSTRVDSILSFQNSHYISHLSGAVYDYVETPTFNYYQYLQKDVQINNIVSENQYVVGFGSLSLENVIKADEKSGKSQFLFTGAELSQAGLTPGDIDGILLNASDNSDVKFFRIGIKLTTETNLDPASPHPDGFTEVFFTDFSFVTGDNRIQFHTPFGWDGTSNILIEFSFTNHSPSNQLNIEGEDTGENYGIYSNNGTHIINDIGYTAIPAGPLSSISEEITVSFWSNGTPEFLPAPTTIISGIDNENKRQLNIHHPWSNSSIYFDCGYADGGYDRINKEATQGEIEGQWNHWAFTKNAVSGEMKIFLNGDLWHSGGDKTKLIDIQDLILGYLHSSNRYYFGKIDEVRIWSKELDESTIQDWMNINVDNSHPFYSELVAYYKLNEGTGTTTGDSSPYNETGEIYDHVLWFYERGKNLTRDFQITTLRPNVTFLQGVYNLTINDLLVTDSIENLANVVIEYEIIPRYGTMLHDSINIASNNLFWQSGYEYVYNPDGILIDSIEILPTGTIELTELPYYKRYPCKYEIMSFVTPYGIYLDLGMEGKTWYFDITDFTPFLKGWKRMTVELGGQRQEDMDIKFLFIVGTPPRDVLDNNQIWRASGQGYQNILNDRAYEPRIFPMDPNGEYFKIRSIVTGHGQQGEFVPRMHQLNIDEGNLEFEWQIWTECSIIPIYPQGGTWLYDRAGWCPGDPSDVAEFDITQYVTPGQSHIIDYGLEYASGQSSYQVNHQLVTYGSANFVNDAALQVITKPNTTAAYQRFNPACTHPIALIQNTGSETLTSLNLEYYVEGGQLLTYNWTGSLDFMETEEVELEIPDYDFWSGTENKFYVLISNPNGEEDEYQYNNTIGLEFAEVELIDIDVTPLIIECKTNLQGYHTSYTLTDLAGNIILERDNLENNTAYSDEVTLGLGCYKLRIDDSGDNGLYYWHQPQYGSGYFRVRENSG
ncbi:MAG: hypothetical protein K8R53_12935, partial [Bacteroidales bacterium]|nr:hypothetical protein [Bacteroidales bacterium]